MAITSTGYDGSINETQWANLLPLAGSSHYGVDGQGDWKVTTSALDRSVTVAPGRGWGQGVMDTSDSNVTLQGATIGSGSRWDMVVARRNWGGLGGTTSFVMITGSSSKVLPVRNSNPGVLDDQPLALIQFTAGSTSPTQIVDLRCFGRNGGVSASDELALTYLKQPGSAVYIKGATWICALDANGSAAWSTAHVMGSAPLFDAGNTIYGSLPSTQKQFLIQAGSTVQTTDSLGLARITWPTPFPNGLLSVMAMNGDDDIIGSGGTTIASSGSATHGSSAWGDRTSWLYNLHGFATGSNDGPVVRLKNEQHRVNWIAIGW